MKFTFGWLKEYLDTHEELDEVAERLTALGLEVERLNNQAIELESFTAAYVTETRPHPDADRLSICTVKTTSGTVEVVCGAPNARAGIKAVFAPEGTRIPYTGEILRKAKIRGVASCGMLLSERELGLSDNHDEIVELPSDAAMGAPVAKIMGLDDPIIEVAITPNRQDCLGVHGIARDLAAAGVGALKPLVIDPVPASFSSPIGVDLNFDLETRDACPYFVGRYIRGVKNGPSPDWMQRRLRAIGLRPISALVDITNYMAIAFARPLHVFDADTVNGGIHARLSKPGETIRALDGKKYTLDGSVTVIADESGALGMGGVMGGQASGCTDNTVNVFIESAIFDPVRTAATGRRYQIDSDARYRFERGIDPEFTEPGCEMATRFVLDFCGGEASGLVVAGALGKWQKNIRFHINSVQRLGGVQLSQEGSRRILQSLGFVVEGEGEVLNVQPPPWRSDIYGEADLVEEIMRVHGFDRIQSVSLDRNTLSSKPILTTAQKNARAARRALAVRGLLEAVTWSFTSSALAESFGGGAAELSLVNPISSGLNAMRPSVLPNLVEAVGRNADRGATEVALFEVGPAYSSDGPEGQSLTAAAVRHGNVYPRHWSVGERPVDALDAKADALSVLAVCGVASSSLTTVSGGPMWCHPGRSGILYQNPRLPLAVFGELHPRILTELGLKGPVVGCEVFLSQIPAKKRKRTSRLPLNAPDFPPVERDFAFLVDMHIESGKVLAAAAKADKMVVDVSLFDVFEGRGVPEGKKSLGICVRLQPRTHTLTDSEIEEAAGRIIGSVIKATGGALRT